MFCLIHGSKIIPILTILFGWLFSMLFLSSCEEIPVFDKEEVVGYRPVYASLQTQISIEEPRGFNAPSKILKYGNYVFIGDLGNGYHIIDNSDRTNMKNIAFFQIPLNRNISIKNGVVYADSGVDLLAIVIQEDQTIEVSRLADVFENEGEILLPPESGFYFECTEDDQGKVIGWVKETIYNPQCYY